MLHIAHLEGNQRVSSASLAMSKAQREGAAMLRSLVIAKEYNWETVQMVEAAERSSDDEARNWTLRDCVAKINKDRRLNTKSGTNNAEASTKSGAGGGGGGNGRSSRPDYRPRKPVDKKHAKCYACGEYGHFKTECPKNNQTKKDA